MAISCSIQVAISSTRATSVDVLVNMLQWNGRSPRCIGINSAWFTWMRCEHLTTDLTVRERRWIVPDIARVVRANIGFLFVAGGDEHTTWLYGVECTCPNKALPRSGPCLDHV
ncbi:hypothetical protein PISMIDRAFT_463960 [Pisolithus microcarpus 441]|uniref:Uncharacterized protein n=1 Tax=Pisolithus microcarpus 441 TaxID=765257 RepID=A0A0C9YP57_9AGAM|nr:hypothetical protein PISMIDRAFT_463960 [Pisolithus microcarpus 441]